jgi:hypothetical protein
MAFYLKFKSASLNRALKAVDKDSSARNNKKTPDRRQGWLLIVCVEVYYGSTTQEKIKSEAPSALICKATAP